MGQILLGKNYVCLYGVYKINSNLGRGYLKLIYFLNFHYDFAKYTHFIKWCIINYL